VLHNPTRFKGRLIFIAALTKARYITIMAG